MITITTLDRRTCDTDTCSRAGTVNIDGLIVNGGLNLCRRCARILAERIAAALRKNEAE